jgi:hypothetical protein
MTPELTTEELESLHKEATDLYDLYFRSNAKHKVNVDQNIAMEVFKSKHSGRYYITVLHIILIKSIYTIQYASIYFASFYHLVLNGPETNVTQLRTTTPLFKAYEEVYSNLETKMCPLFYKSEEVSCILV